MKINQIKEHYILKHDENLINEPNIVEIKFNKDKV